MREVLKNIPVEDAVSILLDLPVKRREEAAPVERANGRVLSQDVYAVEMIPPFARSPFDGYAFRGEDTANASAENPVTLHITEEIPAGKAPEFEVGAGQAAKILTGAPIPRGVNATIKYEDTRFDAESVTLFAPVAAGSNVCPAGEDVRTGDLIAAAGTLITPPVAGLLAGLGVCRPPVWEKPVVSIVNTGNELLYAHEPLAPAKIRNSSCYTLGAYLENAGAAVRDGGTVPDEVARIAQAIEKAMESADMVITTGGISVGDYDLVYAAAEKLGADILFWKVQMKPGSALMAAVLHGKCLLALSGNPASAAIGLHMVGMPFVKKLAGRTDVQNEPVQVYLKEGFRKASPQRRFVRGRLVLKDGRAWFSQTGRQGNGVVSSLVGCDMFAEIPAGSPPVEAGALLRAYPVGR